jgi:very-short-patch-repair endonuclease
VRGQGYRILRFSDDDVRNNVEGVVRMIERAVHELRALIA